MNQHFPVIIEQDSDGVFIAECLCVSGCRSYGHSIEEVMNNIKEAIEVCIEEEAIDKTNLTFIGIRDLEIAVS